MSGTAAPITLVTPLPDIWYNSIRNESGKLDSSPVVFAFRLSEEMKALLQAEITTASMTSHTADTVKSTIMRTLAVDVVHYDGSPVTVFCPSSTVHETLVAKPDLTHADMDWHTNVLTVSVTRKLPLSSNHGNRFFRLGFILSLGPHRHVLFTRALQVLAKQGPSERKQRYWAVAKAEPERPAFVLQRVASTACNLYDDFEGRSVPVRDVALVVSTRKRPRQAHPHSDRTTSAFAASAAGGPTPAPLPTLAAPTAPSTGGAADGTVPPPPLAPGTPLWGPAGLGRTDSLAHLGEGGAAVDPFLAMPGSQSLPGDGEASQSSGMFGLGGGGGPVFPSSLGAPFDLARHHSATSISSHLGIPLPGAQA